MNIFKEFVFFVISNKKFIFIPLILIFSILGLILFLAEGSILAPFIYTLF